MSADIEILLSAAENAARNAYSPYSGVKIGAAVFAGGNIYCGCNVENASFGLTVCAERNAVFAAIAGGEKSFDAIAVYSDDVMPMPCGACRQVIAEFAPGCDVVVRCGDRTVRIRADELLPRSFVFKEKDN